MGQCWIEAEYSILISIFIRHAGLIDIFHTDQKSLETVTESLNNLRNNVNKRSCSAVRQQLPRLLQKFVLFHKLRTYQPTNRITWMPYHQMHQLFTIKRPPIEFLEELGENPYGSGGQMTHVWTERHLLTLLNFYKEERHVHVFTDQDHVGPWKAAQRLLLLHGIDVRPETIRAKIATITKDYKDFRRQQTEGRKVTIIPPYCDILALLILYP